MDPTHLTPVVAPAAGAMALLLLLSATIRVIFRLQPRGAAEGPDADWQGGQGEFLSVTGMPGDDDARTGSPAGTASPALEMAFKSVASSAVGGTRRQTRGASEARPVSDPVPQAVTRRELEQPEYLGASLDRWWGINE